MQAGSPAPHWAQGRMGQWLLLKAGSRQSTGCSHPASSPVIPGKSRNSSRAALWRHSKVSRDGRPEIYKGLFMSPCSSLDKATRRWDLSQQGDVLCMKVTAESREARRAAVWLKAAGWPRAPQQPQYKRRHERKE